MKIINYVLANINNYKDIEEQLISIDEECIISDTCPEDFGLINKYDCDNERVIGHRCEDCWDQQIDTIEN